MTNSSTTYNTRFYGRREEVKNILSSITDWINKDTVGVYENRLQAVVMRCTSIISAVYYIFLAVLFILNGQVILGIYDLLGISVLCYSVYLTYRRHVKEAFWIYNLSIVFLVIFQVIYAGWEIGFQHSIFLLIIVTMFTTYYPLVIKLILSAAYTIIFCAVYMYSELHMPYVIFINDTGRLVSVVNAIYVFGCLAVAGFYFSARSSEMEKKLVKYNKTLERLAFFDPLTGLYNRRQMISFLERKLGTMTDDGSRGLTVAIGDIDYFKKVNDVYGHECGDRVMKDVSVLINGYVEKKGIAARWGGEEFLMIFPDTDREQAVSFINGLIKDIREHEIDYNGQIVKVTMSFGVCQYDNNLTMDELINKADMNLYSAKKGGRDRVV